MTKGQLEYRRFLKSEFWKELSARFKRKYKRCQDCGRRRVLQAHHVRYPASWYETTEADLRALCRVCHLKRHGYRVIVNGIMPYREDNRFNCIIHRTRMLRRKLESGRPLRDRDRRFLLFARRQYPPKKKDACVQYHCNEVLRWEKMMREDGFNV